MTPTSRSTTAPPNLRPLHWWRRPPSRRVWPYRAPRVGGLGRGRPGRIQVGWEGGAAAGPGGHRGGDRAGTQGDGGEIGVWRRTMPRRGSAPQVPHRPLDLGQRTGRCGVGTRSGSSHRANSTSDWQTSVQSVRQGGNQDNGQGRPGTTEQRAQHRQRGATIERALARRPSFASNGTSRTAPTLTGDNTAIGHHQNNTAKLPPPPTKEDSAKRPSTGATYRQ